MLTCRRPGYCLEIHSEPREDSSPSNAVEHGTRLAGEEGRISCGRYQVAQLGELDSETELEDWPSLSNVS